MSAIDSKMSEVMAKFKGAGAALIHEKMTTVYQPEYLAEKQRMLDANALLTGVPAKKAKVEQDEFLRVMNEQELQVVLISMLPVLRIELGTATDKCKYQIGTQSGVLLIKTN